MPGRIDASRSVETLEPPGASPSAAIRSAGAVHVVECTEMRLVGKLGHIRAARRSIRIDTVGRPRVKQLEPGTGGSASGESCYQRSIACADPRTVSQESDSEESTLCSES